MNIVFARNLKKLMTQLKITNSQLARALNVDPSLVSRWLKNGCGERRAAEHALAIEKFVLRQKLTPENKAWLSSEIGKPVFSGMLTGQIAQWLYPKTLLMEETDKGQDGFSNLLLVDSFHSSIEESTSSFSLNLDPPLSVCDGTDKISSLLREELDGLKEGTTINIFLNSETSSVAIDSKILNVLIPAVRKQNLKLHMLVESANNSSMASRLISVYMPLLVHGNLTLSVIQGTPQTFTITMSVIIPKRSAMIITETAQRRSIAVGTVIREPAIVQDMFDSFQNSTHFARPLMTAYNDSFARNIIEVFFEEYGVPGSLDVIKSGLNPMYMTVEQYRKVLQDFNHSEDQLNWRYNEFVRFKTAMDEILQSSRFREVLSLSKLQEIAETGRCRMPSMYFMETGTTFLDALDCVNLLNGYIHFLNTIPNFQVVLLDDDEHLFVSNSCWHIKNNKHVMIHSWNIDEPLMVYSDQLMLIDEFQRYFDNLWMQTETAGSKLHVIETLKALRDQCAEHIGKDER